MKSLQTYFKGDYMFHVCQADVLGFGQYKTGYITLPDGHPATGVLYDELPNLGVNFSNDSNGFIDFENRWTFGFDTASQIHVRKFQTSEYVKKRLDDIYTHLKEMESA
jgi:hypothetical protein